MNYVPRKRKREPMGLREPAQWCSQRHLKFIRSLCCVLEGKDGHVCGGEIEAMHVRSGTDGGTSVKPSDFWTLTGCSHAHHEQHSIGEAAWERKWKVDMKQIVLSLSKTSPCAVEIAEWKKERERIIHDRPER